MFFHPPIGSGGQTCAKVPSWMKNAMSNRIINGQFVPSPIPWQIRLHVTFNSIGFATSFCGGTILDEKTILTAAHCFFHKKSGLIFYSKTFIVTM